MRKKITANIKYLPSVITVILCTLGLLLSPVKTAEGVKAGLTLAGNNLIPSLFPFMVLSSYIVNSSVSDIIAKLLNKPALKIFKVNGYGLCAVILGLMGGYPIGARAVAEFYTQKKISKKQAQTLLLWCVNPGPAFVIISIGTFMYTRIKIGVILYVSVVTASLITGITASFFIKEDYAPPIIIRENKNENIFVNSVKNASRAMLSICSWVLVFSASGELVAEYFPSAFATVFKSLSEVTTGCCTVASLKLPLPLTCGILGFGGFAILFQIADYLHQCSVKPQFYICTRIINGSLSAFICSELLKFFPESVAVFSHITVNGVVFPLYHSISSAIVLILMFILFILEVDNKKKVC